MSEIRWQKALDAYHEQHEEILTDGDARSAAMFSIDESDEKTAHVWHVHQIFADEDGDHDFGIMGDVDLDATQDGGEVIFKNYRVGFIEDLLGLAVHTETKEAGPLATSPAAPLFALCAMPTRQPQPHTNPPRRAHRCL